MINNICKYCGKPLEKQRIQNSPRGYCCLICRKFVYLKKFPVKSKYKKKFSKHRQNKNKLIHPEGVKKFSAIKELNKQIKRT